MFGMSLEAERAARIRAEQIVEAATTQLQEANEVMRAATEAAKAAIETAQRIKREMNAWKEFMMKKFDPSTFVSHSHDYDDDLDDQSLDEIITIRLLHTKYYNVFCSDDRSCHADPCSCAISSPFLCRGSDLVLVTSLTISSPHTPNHPLIGQDTF
ncbi:hypothetical protein KIW84_062021 [Lathyrus oleraceus]|uniref:Uncharacterized protein n=1 Tax=Pisum sativum TaxID=3888 RepID=A0A9D4W7I2_PEA|nr:hypothetical protein KIW84_062021 [Pisum sativum]